MRNCCTAVYGSRQVLNSSRVQWSLIFGVRNRVRLALFLALRERPVLIDGQAVPGLGLARRPANGQAARLVVGTEAEDHAAIAGGQVTAAPLDGADQRA